MAELFTGELGRVANGNAHPLAKAVIEALKKRFRNAEATQASQPDTRFGAVGLYVDVRNPSTGENVYLAVNASPEGRSGTAQALPDLSTAESSARIAIQAEAARAAEAWAIATREDDLETVEIDTSPEATQERTLRYSKEGASSSKTPSEAMRPTSRRSRPAFDGVARDFGTCRGLAAAASAIAPSWSAFATRSPRLWAALWCSITPLSSETPKVCWRHDRRPRSELRKDASAEPSARSVTPSKLRPRTGPPRPRCRRLVSRSRSTTTAHRATAEPWRRHTRQWASASRLPSRPIRRDAKLTAAQWPLTAG